MKVISSTDIEHEIVNQVQLGEQQMFILKLAYPAYIEGVLTQYILATESSLRNVPLVGESVEVI